MPPDCVAGLASGTKHQLGSFGFSDGCESLQGRVRGAATETGEHRRLPTNCVGRLLLRARSPSRRDRVRCHCSPTNVQIASSSLSWTVHRAHSRRMSRCAHHRRLHLVSGSLTNHGLVVAVDPATHSCSAAIARATTSLLAEQGHQSWRYADGREQRGVVL